MSRRGPGSRLRGWMVGQAMVAIFVGISGGVGLWIIGVPLYISFGLFAGVLNVVPYLGSIGGSMLPALLALTISPVKALLVVALFVFLNQVEGYVLQPMVIGRETKLHPAIVIVSFLVFGALLGLVGALPAVPAAVLCSTLMDELLPDEAPERIGILGHERPPGVPSCWTRGRRTGREAGRESGRSRP